ncbi:MAG TPA: non-heme iron oxygenase ferredoxin subunit [Longimicrobium sp.]
MAWVRAAALAELASGAALGVELGGKRVCVARVEDEFYALLDNCSHRDFPLSPGEVDVDDCSITCEWHGAVFDLRTGAPTCPPAARPVPVFETRVEGDSVWVDMP